MLSWRKCSHWLLSLIWWVLAVVGCVCSRLSGHLSRAAALLKLTHTSQTTRVISWDNARDAFSTCWTCAVHRYALWWARCMSQWVIGVVFEFSNKTTVIFAHLICRDDRLVLPWCCECLIVRRLLGISEWLRDRTQHASVAQLSGPFARQAWCFRILSFVKWALHYLCFMSEVNPCGATNILTRSFFKAYCDLLGLFRRYIFTIGLRRRHLDLWSCFS